MSRQLLVTVSAGRDTEHNQEELGQFEYPLAGSPFIPPPLARPPPSLQRPSRPVFELDPARFAASSTFSSSVGCWDDSTRSPSTFYYPSSRSSISSSSSFDSFDSLYSLGQHDLTPWLSSRESDVWSTSSYEDLDEARSVLKPPSRRTAVPDSNSFYLPPLFPGNPSLTRPSPSKHLSAGAQSKPSTDRKPRDSAFGFCAPFYSCHNVAARPKPEQTPSIRITKPVILKRPAASRAHSTVNNPPHNPWRVQLLSQVVSQSLVSVQTPTYSSPRTPQSPQSAQPIRNR